MMSQSAFAGYGLKRACLFCNTYALLRRNPLSLDMGWKEQRRHGIGQMRGSQSAFAGYGLKSQPISTSIETYSCRNPLSLDMGWKVEELIGKKGILCVAIRFRWIWVEKKLSKIQEPRSGCRNPLSLDMGWKETYQTRTALSFTSQSAFAGYGLKSEQWTKGLSTIFVAIRFRWIWVEKIFFLIHGSDF